MTKEELLAKRNHTGAPVEVIVGDPPEAHYLRRMTVAEHESYISWCVKNKDEYVGTRSRLLVRTLSNPDGKRQFNDNEIGLIEALPNDLVEALFDKATEVCGFTKSIEDREKNSETTASDNFATI